MTALYIVLILAAAVALILSLGVKINLSLKSVNGTSNVSVYLTVGPIKVRLLPKKRKKIKLSDYSAKKYREYLEKEKADLSAPKAVSEKKEAAKSTDFMSDLKEFRYILSKLLENSSKHIKCTVIDFRISAGTGEAASTALLYPCICAAVSAIIQLLKSSVKLDLKNPENISVDPDFLGSSVSADINTSFGTNVFGLVCTFGGIAVSFIKRAIRNDKKKGY